MDQFYVSGEVAVRRCTMAVGKKNTSRSKVSRRKAECGISRGWFSLSKRISCEHPPSDGGCCMSKRQ